MNNYNKRGRSICGRAILLTAGMILITSASTKVHADTGTCGGQMITLPFTDVAASNVFFCSIAEAFFSGLTNGTTPTTYSPSANVPREQMAAFVTRTLDQSLKRGSRRAALRQFWTPTSGDGLGLTSVGVVGDNPLFVESDGADVWLTDKGFGQVSRVRGSDGKLLETWTGATDAECVLVAKGLIFVTGNTSPGKLYRIDPTQGAGPVTVLTSALGPFPVGLAFDGARIWTANQIGSVSIVTLNPLSVSTVTAGFINPIFILYDGANMWVADAGAHKLFKLDSNGAVIQDVAIGGPPALPVFDGTNIWLPDKTNKITVVRASTGAVISTLMGNGLDNPFAAAFDGERILATNFFGSSVSLWKAADLTPLGSVSTGPNTFPTGVCSDGLNFWITLNGPAQGQLARF